MVLVVALCVMVSRLVGGSFVHSSFMMRQIKGDGSYYGWQRVLWKARTVSSSIWPPPLDFGGGFELMAWNVVVFAKAESSVPPPWPCQSMRTIPAYWHTQCWCHITSPDSTTVLLVPTWFPTFRAIPTGHRYKSRTWIDPDCIPSGPPWWLVSIIDTDHTTVPSKIAISVDHHRHRWQLEHYDVWGAPKWSP